MDIKPMLPIKVVEVETNNISSLDSLEKLVLFLEEFWDILEEDFQLFDSNGKQLHFSEQQYSALASELKK